MMELVEDGEFFFDADAAARAEAFIEGVCVHTKGRWMGDPFRLTDWERTIVRDVFGWKRRRDGLRRFRVVYISVPRKNGKSEFAACFGLLLLCADDENSPEVYSAAADRDQATLTHAPAKMMIQLSDALGERLEVTRYTIFYPPILGSWKVLSSIAQTKHGLNSHGILVDELHAHKTRKLCDALTTSTGAREQPLTVYITTAGEEEEGSIFCETDDWAQQVARGAVNDPSFYPFICRADPEDDWRSPATWEKANPSYGVTVGEDFFRQELARAEASPASRATFKRLYLNMRMRAHTRFLELDQWDRGAGEELEDLLERNRGRTCYGGLDLSSKVDLTALSLVWPPGDMDEGIFDVACWFWTPEGRVEQASREDRVPYGEWVAQGWLEPTPGDVIDYRFVRKRLNDLKKSFRIQEVAFDRWGALAIFPQLEEDDFTMVEFGQGTKSMSDPTKELERLVLGGRIRHAGNPVLRWNMDCLEVAHGPTGEIKPKKPDTRKTRKRIDGAVAVIMALARAMALGADPDPPSVYDQRGIRFL